MADIARLTKIIEPQAAALGFDLVRVKLAGAGLERTLQIMAEDPATGQLIVEQCAALSRAVSGAIDTAEEQGEELIAGAYHLEVSSPGIDRPLTRAKDFAAWAGHELRISLTDKVDGHRKLHGELIGIEDDIVLIEDRKSGRVEVPLNAIHAAQLVLTNELIAATKPLDTSGAVEVDDREIDNTEEYDDTPDEEEAHN